MFEIVLNFPIDNKNYGFESYFVSDKDEIWEDADSAMDRQKGAKWVCEYFNMQSCVGHSKVPIVVNTSDREDAPLWRITLKNLKPLYKLHKHLLSFKLLYRF